VPVLLPFPAPLKLPVPAMPAEVPAPVVPKLSADEEVPAVPKLSAEASVQDVLKPSEEEPAVVFSEGAWSSLSVNAFLFSNLSSDMIDRLSFYFKKNESSS
jgi:hypothetical protein